MHLAQQEHIVHSSLGRLVHLNSCSAPWRQFAVIFWCRLLASKQAEQQRVLRKETHGLQQHVHQQRQQRNGPGRLQADQDGPGDTRPDGPR